MNCKSKSVHHKCSDCDKIFNNIRYYKRHVEGHRNNNCTNCDEKFTHRKHLKNHMLHVHNMKENACFQCPHCEQKYVKRITLVVHIAKNHSNGQYSCLECAAMFSVEEDYKAHIEEHDRQKLYSCERCGCKFYRKQQYLVHLKQHDKYECITCNVKYADKKRLLQHKRMGHETRGLESKYICEICSKTFGTKILLDVHLKKHKNSQVENLEDFEKCAKKSVYENKTKNHKPQHLQKCEDNNDGEMITYFCKICRKIFDKKSKFDQHQERVHSDKEYSCSLCSHQSNNKTNLVEHMRLHLTHERTFVCDNCGKSFYRNSALKEHKMLVHSEELRFSCEICGKSFKRNSEISRHLQTHSEERPYVCGQCGQSYKRKTHLKRHQFTSHGIISTNNGRHVQRLVKNSKGEYVPVEDNEITNNDYSNTPIILTDNTKESETLTRNIEHSQSCDDLIDSYQPTELWINKSNENYIQENQQNQSFNSDSYMNTSNIHLDHIDTKDLIVLSSDQMLSVEAVVDGNHTLPDYLQSFNYL